jgi:hypothetical protein
MFARNLDLFAIGESDLTNTGVHSIVNLAVGNSYESFSNFSVANNSISFTIAGQLKSYQQPKVFFMLDSSPTIYDSFQDITEGTHTVKKYQMTINSPTEVQIQKWEKTYDILVKIQNVTVANQTIYVNNTVYQNQTVYVNQTVEKIVTVEPDLNAYFQKYQMYIFAIIAVGLIYYWTRRKI